MTDVEVRLGNVSVGTIYRSSGERGERIAFRYTDEWLSYDGHFAIDPELFLDRSTTVPARAPLFGAFSDSAPDRWGRRLMQRHERHLADNEKRAIRTLSELDYVLGVSDLARQGALRFVQDGEIVAASEDVPPLAKLADLLRAADRLERDEAQADDLALLLATGSSLGGARPKASVRDRRGTSTALSGGSRLHSSWPARRVSMWQRPTCSPSPGAMFCCRSASTVTARSACTLLRP